MFRIFFAFNFNLFKNKNYLHFLFQFHKSIVSEIQDCDANVISSRNVELFRIFNIFTRLICDIFYLEPFANVAVCFEM